MALGVTHYLGFDDTTGYAEAARRCFRALVARNADVTWVPFVLSPDWGLGYAPRDHSCLGGGPDTVVAHLPAEYYPEVRRRYPGSVLVGHTVWETERLPGPWLPLLEIPDLLVVPTAWNAGTIRAAGVSTPVAVVPHVAVEPAPHDSELWHADGDAFVFYTIAPWTARKSVWNSVRAYLHAFTSEDPVVLVVKTSAPDLTGPAPAAPRVSPVGPGTSAHALAHVVKDFTTPAAIRLVTRVLPDSDVAALHRRGECFVSLCRAEGWGLGAFDAAAYGNAIVTTAFGGHLAYLDEATAYLVDFDLVPATDGVPGTLYAPDQRWAEPSLADGARRLRQVFDDRDRVAKRTELLKRRIARRYAPSTIAAMFVAAVAGVPRHSL